MTVGITGGAGFIGSFLTTHLLRNTGWAVRVLTRNRAAQIPEGAEAIYGDLRSSADCLRFARGLQVVYYLAHRNTPLDSDGDLPADAEANIVPLLTLLQAVKRLGVKPHVVYFSSGGTVYGECAEQTPFAETHPCLPLCSYGIQKLAAEHYLRLAVHGGAVTATVLRVANAYGALLSRARMQGLIGIAVADALAGRPIHVFGSMENVRDYIHVRDICAIARIAAEPCGSYSLFNVGSGVGHSVAEVLSMIETCAGHPLTLEHDPESGSGLLDWAVLDVSKARRELGWTPTVSIRNGIEMLFASAPELTPAAEALAAAQAAGGPD